MTLTEQLSAIRDEHGSLTPEVVVDAASHPDHPLHSRFDWDDTVAARKWRLEQAGQLLRVTYKPHPDKPSDLRAFVALKGEDSARAEYVPTGEAMSNPISREIVLRSMDREWKAFKRRYQEMREFSDLVRSEASVLDQEAV